MRPHARLLLATALACGLAACGGGGGGGGGGGTPPLQTGPLLPEHLAVLVAEGDATSEAIAAEYQRARGIPAANIVRVPVSTASDVIGAADFATLKAAVDAKLPSQVQATLVTWLRPSRVQGACAMGLTSALAFGYDARWCGQCATTATSPYYDSATRRPYSDLGLRPSMMLGAATLAEAQALIARGVAADASFANGKTGHAWLVRTSDATRSLRWPDFQDLAAAGVPGLTMHYVDNASGAGSNEVSGQADVMFYFTGLHVLTQAGSNRYLPGAVADTLTSYSGELGGNSGQFAVTDWLKAGVTASFGTVEEPCALAPKFPRATVLARHYQAGETLIEAYWKSVQWPGQGLFVGEPLARPWAK